MISSRASGLLRAKATSCSRRHTVELLAEARRQRVEVDVFDRHADVVGSVLACAALRLANADPVGGAVAGAFEAGSVNEGLDEMNRMPVLGQPVRGEAAGKTREQVRGQMRHAHPRQDEEAHVVGDPGKALGPGRFVPTDELVARVHPPRGGAKERAAQVAALAVASEISHVLAHRPAQAQIVIAHKILGQQSVARLLGRERLDRQGEQFAQGLRDGFRVGPRQLRVGKPDQALGRRLPAFGQADESALLQFDQQAGAREVLQPSCGRPPVPGFGQGQCDLVAAPLGMLRDESAHERHLFVADGAALNAAHSVHTPIIYNMEMC